MKQLVIGLAAIGLMAGCASNAGTGASTGAPAAGTSALATLAPKSGSNVQGTIKLLQQGDNRVAMAVDIAGLPPNGMFGFHVHEKGDCSSPDGMSAGGHFNPTGQPHGDPRSGPHHAGDIPMLQSDASGKAVGSIVLNGVTLTPGATSLVGRAVIVHAGMDDYKTQPTGNSGGRVACGVIVAN
ncbi:superoxide dismutase family protein [Ralstonia nicotianae]|uniref:Superoxide dismutase [Cu-Zn] n=1 Tax=Ralstonia solanacearum TaxID=305 RepID=A0A0K1ZIN7_RALSL|nr:MULTISPECIES: superoxide dismutase family protein [Ralstonia]AKZ25879.1 superoxide dismutase [Ralstonia solanacearum]APC69196.1 superoxide dismutase family protein [Ralstonia solanacearum OE1-1]API74064.1 superoxide dismutase [Ralstonia pseudosolanacearum]ASL74250.1 superoxide dismutase [Ralstonia pseudosolanacearum]AUS43015.1 superoxide dismutase family protein [Ralstonia solanacearum]